MKKNEKKLGIRAMKNRLQNNICKVVFQKSDGSERELIGTLQPKLVKTFLGEDWESDGRPSPKGVITLIDLQKDDWRSFKVDSVKSFEIWKRL